MGLISLSPSAYIDLIPHYEGTFVIGLIWSTSHLCIGQFVLLKNIKKNIKLLEIILIEYIFK